MTIARRLAAAALAATLAAALLVPAAPARAQAQSEATAFAAVSKRVERRLARLHDELGITPAEEPLWARYAATTRSNAQAMGALFDQRRSGLPTMTADANIRSLTALAEQHAADMRRLQTAFEALYAAMPPAQKATADSVLRRHSMDHHREDHH